MLSVYTQQLHNTSLTYHTLLCEKNIIYRFEALMPSEYNYGIQHIWMRVSDSEFSYGYKKICVNMNH